MSTPHDLGDLEFDDVRVESRARRLLKAGIEVPLPVLVVTELESADGQKPLLEEPFEMYLRRFQMPAARRVDRGRDSASTVRFASATLLSQKEDQVVISLTIVTVSIGDGARH